MRRIVLTAAAALLLLVAPGFGQMTHDHMSMTPDERQTLDFPPMARDHMLGAMRGHFIALQEILAALSGGDGPAAAKIARERLGVESPNAAACVRTKDDGASHAGGMSGMAEMMMRHMPEDMRAMGRTMHESASAFAEIAAKTPAGADPKPALAALAQVTQNCAACHAAYRLR